MNRNADGEVISREWLLKSDKILPRQFFVVMQITVRWTFLPGLNA
jgi:hypothetical protein